MPAAESSEPYHQATENEAPRCAVQPLTEQAASEQAAVPSSAVFAVS